MRDYEVRTKIKIDFLRNRFDFMLLCHFNCKI